MTPDGEQLTLAGVPGIRAPRRTRRAPLAPAAVNPVARVVVDVSLAHLDRTFEYTVPEPLADVALPGVRVKMRFAGKDVAGFVLERVAAAEHTGTLAPIRRVVSPEQVLTPPVLALARGVAANYGGTLADVLRLAIPPRHARAEAERWSTGMRPVDDPTRTVAPGASTTAEAIRGTGLRPSALAWQAYRGGPALLQHLLAGRAPRAVWTALPAPPGESWMDAIAEAVVSTVLSGRGALVVVPDARDVARVSTSLATAGIGRWDAAPVDPGAVPMARHVTLIADDGPAPRYRSFLAALRGSAQVVVGTRGAVFAPVAHLGLVVCWDDGDDLHAEPRAPYPHVREVLRLRSELEGAAMLLGGFARSTEGQLLVEDGWAMPLQPDRSIVRDRTPRVRALTSVELARDGAAASARLPSEAWRAAHEALDRGPVLVQVPRSGYLPAIACARCRALARCATCHGALSLSSSHAPPQCARCGTLAGTWRCPECSGAGLRAVRIGSARTAEELGRAFPGVPVHSSGTATGGVIADVSGRPALVVATPGAEPLAEHGYAAALLLDAAVATSREGLHASEEALRRWLTAAALVRPAAAGGLVLLVGDGAPVPTQALVRWDPVGFAQRELAERRELRLPPVVASAGLRGSHDAVAAFLEHLALPIGAEVLGPVQEVNRPEPAPALWRALVRAPIGTRGALAAAVHDRLAVRSARKESGTLRVAMDPQEMW